MLRVELNSVTQMLNISGLFIVLLCAASKGGVDIAWFSTGPHSTVRRVSTAVIRRVRIASLPTLIVLSWRRLSKRSDLIR